MPTAGDTVTLIYDGNCPLCNRAVDWVLKRVRPGSVDAVACQDPARSKRFPQVAEAACLEAMQLVLPSGRVEAGEQALPHLLDLMTGWRWLAKFLRLPVAGWFAPFVYRVVARNRYMLSIIVARKHRPNSEAPSTERKCE